MHAVKRTGTDNFAEELLCRIVHQGDVVAVPAYGTAHMQHQLRNKLQQSAHLVGRGFRGMIMAGVDCEDFPVFGGVCGIEVMAAYGEALQPDSENLTLNAILHVHLFLSENLI